jgi:HEPN domain-containing protein
MATSLDFARELIAAADRDLVILAKGIPDPEISIEVLGFHCQQAVEKYLKAALAIHQVEFHKIHDIKTLTDLARSAGMEVPSSEPLEALTPFAVEFRYQTLPQGESPVAREKMTELAQEVRKWANQQVLKAQAAAQDDAGSHQEP